MAHTDAVEVVTTATLRPHLLDVTYASFFAGMDLENHTYRLILNIDPVGEAGATPEDVLTVAEKYFPSITTNVADKGSYPAAVIWAWQQTTTDLVFHLEDDWRLCRSVNWDKLQTTLDDHPDLSSLTLSKYDLKNDSLLAYQQQMYLGPCLVRQAYVQAMLPHLRPDEHTEIQMRHRHRRNGVRNAQFRHAYYGGEGPRRLLQHLGPEWMRQNGHSHKRRMLTWNERKEATA